MLQLDEGSEQIDVRVCVQRYYVPNTGYFQVTAQKIIEFLGIKNENDDDIPLYFDILVDLDSKMWKGQNVCKTC